MSDGKEENKVEPCEGIRQARETDKEIKEILKLISVMNADNKVNAANLTNLSGAYKELATANNLTHYKLFSRTEDLKVKLTTVKTSHDDHIKHGGVIVATGRYKHVILVSWAAIVISLAATVVMGLVQAGILHR